MPRIKLTKPSFVNLTGQLPGKNFRGVNFTDGISDEVPLAVVDKIAAQIGGDLVDEAGEVIGPAGSQYRKTSIVPTPQVPRSESKYPETGAADPEFIAKVEEYRDEMIGLRDEADTSANTAAGWASNAGESATDAAASAANAKTSETNAAASAAAAAQSAQDAADAAASVGA